MKIKLTCSFCEKILLEIGIRQLHCEIHGKDYSIGRKIHFFEITK
jgi:hypothetical protein